MDGECCPRCPTGNKVVCGIERGTGGTGAAVVSASDGGTKPAPRDETFSGPPPRRACRRDTRATYLSLATFHGYVEVALPAFFVARRAQAQAAS